MANELVRELQKKAAEARSGGYLKLKDGETMTLVKTAEAETAVGNFGTQVVFAVQKEDGSKARLAFKVGHPAIDPINDLKVGGKFKVKRTGTTQKDTRYTVVVL